jgi:hypothetical protein
MIHVLHGRVAVAAGLDLAHAAIQAFDESERNPVLSLAP